MTVDTQEENRAVGKQLVQALRGAPQWGAMNPQLGPPMGKTWYDSLQTKVTKRYSHGLDIQYAFTWQKELANGANSDTSYLTPNPALNGKYTMLGKVVKGIEVADKVMPDDVIKNVTVK